MWKIISRIGSNGSTIGLYIFDEKIGYKDFYSNILLEVQDELMAII